MLERYLSFCAIWKLRNARLACKRVCCRTHRRLGNVRLRKKLCLCALTRIINDIFFVQECSCPWRCSMLVCTRSPNFKVAPSLLQLLFSLRLGWLSHVSKGGELSAMVCSSLLQSQKLPSSTSMCGSFFFRNCLDSDLRKVRNKHHLFPSWCSEDWKMISWSSLLMSKSSLLKGCLASSKAVTTMHLVEDFSKLS